MFILDNFKSLEENAEELFPKHWAISPVTFKKAKMRYFNRIKPLDCYTKNLYFKSTYFSSEGICCFILKELIYFLLMRQAGSSEQESYYGSCERIFNF